MGGSEGLLGDAGSGVFAKSLLESASLLDNQPFVKLNPLPASGAQNPFAELDAFPSQTSSDLNNKGKTAKWKAPSEIPALFEPDYIPLSNQGANARLSSTPTNSDPLTGMAMPASFTAAAAPMAASMSTQASASSTAPPLPYAVVAEGTLTINNGGDFDGVPIDPTDDALIHAGKGFTINNSPILPVQRDANGIPILNSAGKQVLVDRAVTVAPGYGTINAPNNQYAGLVPPQVVDKQIVTVPVYADLKQQELNRRVPAGTPTVTFNASTNPINNLADWNSKFPPSGTTANPKVVRVTNGGLNVPGGVNLSNYVITIDNGDLNFNGNGHTFNNVMVVTNNGNVNLADVSSTDLAVFSSGGINMNNTARFGGSTLLATGSSNGTVNFNGATTGTTPSHNLRVIAQGDITYNAALSSRGQFLGAKNFTFNNTSTLYGSIGVKNNIIFNGNGTVIYAAISGPDTTPPTITAALVNDTGSSNTDRLTYDPTISGTITDASGITGFKAGFNNTPIANYQNVLSSLGGSGTFTFTRTQLEQIYGGTLPDGAQVLHLQATDSSGNVSNVVDVAFTLDTTLPLSMVLDPAFDSAPLGDSQTTTAIVTLSGQAEAGAQLTLSTGATTAANASGQFTFTNVALAVGDNPFTVQAVDAAGNQWTTALSVNRLAVNSPPTVSSFTKVGAEDTAIGFTVTDFTSQFSDVDGNSLGKVQITSLPPNGTLKLDSVTVTLSQEISTANLSSLSFTPDLNFNGTVSFGWNGFDGTTYATTGATVNLNITPVNDPPVVTNINKSGLEDTDIRFTAADFTSQFADVDGNSLSKIQITSLSSNGTLKLGGVTVALNQEINVAALETLSFTPTLNFNGTTGFTWNGFDGTTYAATGAAVNLTISAVNDAPVVNNLNKLGLEDTDILFTSADFISQFADGDGDSLSKVQITSLPSNGSLTLSGAAVVLNQEINVVDLGNLSFTPTLNFNGSTSFSWNGFDGSTYGAIGAMVNLTISAINDAPVLGNLNKAGAEDTDILFTITDFTSQFTDVDGDTLSKIQITSLPADGILKLGGIGVTLNQEIATADLINLSFTPNSNFSGSTSFSWNGFDGITYGAIGATVNLSISSSNDPPVVTNLSQAGAEDTDIFLTVTDFTSQFSDPDGDSLSKIQITSLPADGTLKLSGTTVGLNQEIATADLANLSFTPNPNFNGSTSFTWNGFDGTTYAAVSASVTLTISAVNDAPLVSTLNKSGLEDTDLLFTVADFASQFGDIDGDLLTKIQITSLPTDGILKLSGMAVALNQEIVATELDNLSFTPVTNFNGSTSFTWNGFDGTAYATTGAAVNLNITPVNDPPVVTPINKSGLEDTDISFSLSDFTNQFTDVDGNSLTKIQITSLPTNGTLKLSGTAVVLNQEIGIANLGSLSFTPNPNFNGSVSFNWNGFDGTTYAAVGATVNLTISAVNDAPSFTSSTLTTVNVGTAYTYTITTTDPDAGDTLLITAPTLPAWLTLVDNGNGTASLSGTPTIAQIGSHPVVLQVSDGIASADQPFTLIVASTNNAPTALNLSGGSIAENSANGTVIGTLSTLDSDAGDTHTYTLLDSAGGRFALKDGNKLVVAKGNLLDFESNTTHTIRVRTTDNGNPALSLETDLTIQVTNVNEAPVFTSTPNLTAETGTLYTYSVVTTDPDSGDTRTLTTTSLPAWLSFIDNGNGTGTLSGTPSFTDSGLYSVTLTATDAAGLTTQQTVLLAVDVVLKEESNFSPTRSVSFNIPASPTILSFKIDPTFDLSDPDSINDAFEVAIVDGNGNSLVHAFASGRDAFFNLSEGVPVALGAGATYNSATQIVSLNLTGLAAGTNATLIFRLVNDDSDITTQVKIQDLALINAPPGTLPPTQPGFAPPPTPPAAPNFALLTDVSPSFQPEYQRTTFNPETKLLYAEVGVRNIGGYSITAPLLVAVTHLSDPTVLVRNPDGFTPDGLPYYDFSRLVTGGKLDPTGVTGTGSLVFYNPNGGQFTYDLVVLSQLNHNPVIQTQPVLEVIGGLPYRYEVRATDPDQDTLTYKLLVAARGMTIDSTTGVIAWNPDISQIGNHSVNVEVTDGHGGTAEQQYTLSVIAAPPNRPPLFTTSPVVDAYINQLYSYDANAIDPDQDPVNYSLVIGPNGMTVNPTTGMVQWTPPPALILGDTVLGRIGIPGQNAEFSFSGVAGERLYFDPLQYTGGAGDWNFKVITPSGRQIVSSTLEWYDNRLLNLDETGNYKIVVDALSDRTGNYGFRVTNPDLVPITSFDTLITDRLSPGTEDRIYRFTAAKGEKLFFYAKSKTASMDWVLYDAKNAVVANNGFGDIEQDIPADGEYLLAVRGAAGFTNTVDYTFSIFNSDLPTAPLMLNATTSGAIAKMGGQHTFTFTGTAGQQLFFDSLDGNANLYYSLVNPQGTKLINGADIRYDREFLDGLTLATNGTYSLIIDGYGGTIGNYKFRLLDKAAAIPTTTEIDITGSFTDNSNSTNLYKFSLSSRQYIYFDGLSPTSPYPGNWSVYNAGGQRINGTALYADQEFWLDPGDYTLVMQGTGATPNYTFRLVTPDLPITPLTLGATTSGTLTKKGQFDTFTFTGTAGQQLFFDSLDGNAALTYSLVNPQGTKLISGAGIGNDRDFLSGLTLTTDGTYSLIVDGTGETIGNYKFRLLDKAAAIPTTTETDIIGSFTDNSTSTNLYTFSLSSRQYIYFDGLSFPNSGNWTVYNSSGQALTGPTNLAYDQEYWLDAGDYTLVMQGAGANPNYTFRLITPSLPTTSLTLGTTTSGSLTRKGQFDTFTFTGTAGQQLFFDSLDGNAPGLTYSLVNPQGTKLINGVSISYGQEFLSGVILTTSGTYSLIVDGTGETIGNYKFRLLDGAAATDITGNFGIDITDTLNPGQSTQLYQFLGNTGQTLRLSAAVAATNASWDLYGPSGQRVSNVWQSWMYQNREVTLPATGIYTLGIVGNNPTATNYTFQITQLAPGTPTVPTGTPLTLGTVINGTINTVGGQDTYTFSGTAGQKLFYDALGGNYFQVSIYDPSGHLIVGGADSRSDRGSPSGLTLSTAGTYRLVVGGSGQDTGIYKFRLLDLDTAPVVALNTTLSGTLDNGNLGATAYRFTLSNRQYLYFDAQQGGGNWAVCQEDGTQIIYGSLNNGDQEFWLDAGEYVLPLNGDGNAANANYQFRIITAPLITFPTPIALGSVVSDSISDKGGQNTYTFSGTAGQKLFYDALSSNYFQVSIYDPNGRLIVGGADSRYDYRPDQLGLTLLATGNYRLVVDGQGEATGNYKFRLLDLSTAPIAALNIPLSGTLDNGNLGATAYRFTLDSRQYVYFDAAPQASGYWYVHRSDGTLAIYDGLYGGDEELWLDAGEYELVFVGDGNAAYANYQFQIVTPTLPTASLNFNDTISDTIAKKGGQNTYTFSGTAGQKLFYDALGGDYFQVSIYDPSGRQINGGFDSRYDRGSDLPGLTLLDTGSYRLVIDGIGEGTGNYKFRLLDLNTAPVVAPDTPLSGTLDNGNLGATAYRFTLDDRQYLYFDAAPQASGSWYVYKGDGTPVTTSYLYGGDTELWLDAGEYELVFAGDGNAAYANYQFQIVTPTLPIASLTFNDTISDAISDKGGQNTYTFSGTAGQKLFYDALGGDYFQVSIYDPNGRLIVGGADSRYDRGPDGSLTGLTLNATGDYRLVVDGQGENTGNYQFRLLDLSNAPLTPLDTDITGIFTTGALSAAAYRFNVIGTQSLYFDAQQGNGNWFVYGPGGQLITSGNLGNDDRELSLAAGEYTLVFQGTGTDPNYRLRIVALDQSTFAYALDTTATGTIAKPGQQNTYTFSGSAGQLLAFDALAGSFNLTVQIYSPSGVRLVNRDTNSDSVPFVLGENGTYRLVIDGVGSTTGAYSFALRDRATASPLVLGTSMTDALNPSNSQKLYRLNGTAGQVVNFNLSAPTWTGANWVLYDPAGVAIATPSATSPNFKAALAATGVYTLAIGGTTSAPVNYSFQVTDVTPAAIAKTGFNTVQSGSFTTAGQINESTFTATAGTVILYDGMDATDNLQRVRLLNPDGTYLFGDGEARYDRGPFVLSQTGTYKVQHSHFYGQASGNYNFRILELPKVPGGPGVNYLELGSPVSGTLSQGQDKVYTFQALPGIKILFNGMSGDGVNANLYDGNGNLVFNLNNFRSGDTGVYTLPLGSVYNLVISADPYATRTYKFQLLEDISAPKITYNVPTSNSQISAQQSAFYQLQATQGQTLFFDNLAFNAPNYPGYPGYLRWAIFAPDGTSITNQELRNDFEVQATQTGTYLLYVQGTEATTPYNYQFRVFAQNPATQVGVVTPGVGQPANNTDGALGRFHVTLQAKDDQGGSALQDYTIRLWADPSNANPVILSQPDAVYGLDEPAYRYQVKSQDPDGDTLAYRLLDGPVGATLNTDTGELLWFPEFAVKNGDQVNFKVEVSDGRGGKDTQAFTVGVYSALGKIQGAVFDDLNSNGLLDSKLIKGDNPSIVFAIDVSGSTIVPFYGTGDYQDVKTVLDAEKAAAKALIETIVAQGAGNKVKIGIIAHEYNAQVLDMDSITPGLQTYTTALADTNSNGTPDVLEAIDALTYGGFNRFVTALQQIDTLVDTFSGTPNLLFMSDGYSGDDLDQLQTAGTELRTKITDRGGNLTAFAVGKVSLLDTMKAIDPNAIQLTDIQEMVDISQGFDPRYTLEPFKQDVTVYLDANNNGQFDAGERYQVTQVDATPNTLGKVNYQYTFDHLLPGTYMVRVVPPAGTIVTTPSESFTDTVTLAGETYSHLFGVGQVLEVPNADPEFKTTPAPLYTLKAGDVLRYDALAFDLNADPVTYDLILAPPGMTVDASTGQVVWSPTAKQVADYYQELQDRLERLGEARRQQIGPQVVEFNVLLRAQDGKGGSALQAIDIQLVPTNRPPMFTSVVPTAKPQVGKLFQYQATAIDSDGDVVSFELVNAPTGVAVNATTGLVTWTPTLAQLGDRAFQLKVKDGKGGESLQSIQTTVIAAVANRLPTITSTPRTTTRLGNAYFYEVVATDPDGDRLTYSLPTAPTGMTIQDGVIAWTPSAAQFGLNSVTVQVTDSQGGSTAQAFTINVASQAPNQAPVITSAPTLVTNLEQEYRYNLTSNDPDGDLVLWSLDQAPAGMVIDARTGVLRWIPSATQLGEQTIAVRVTDSNGAYTGQEFTLSVNGTNLPPLIVSTPLTRGAREQGYTYQVVATDPEGEGLSFSLGSYPQGMTIDQTGKILWTPTATQVGTQRVEVIVTDAQGAAATQRYQVVVGTTAINQAPKITSTPLFVAAVGSVYQYQVVATDSDIGDVLSYQLLQGAAGMAVDASTGLLTWDTPIVGSYQVVVGATDLSGASVAQGFTLTARANLAPVIRSTTPPATATPGMTYRYDVLATDEGKLTYTLDADSLAKGLAIDELGRLSWTPTASQVGTQAVTLGVVDELGTRTEQSFTITVTADNVLPQVNLGVSGLFPAAVGDSVTFLVSGTDNQGVAALSLTVNGVAVALDSRGQATITVDQVGTLTAVATVTDTAGNVQTMSRSFAVIDPNDVNAPVVGLNLEEDVEFTSPTQIRGSVTDGNLDYYTLEVSPVGEENFREVFRSSTPVTDGVLGTFDPSTLQNDAYVLRLKAVDLSGNVTTTERVVGVQGNLKLGNFTLSFTDLEIPVSGIPISLTRTYDSLNAGTTDDFGYGWRMEFRDTDLRTSLRPDPVNEELGIPTVGFKPGTKVFITLPGGKREAFTFSPVASKVNGFLSEEAGKLYYPAFVGDKGVTSTLSVSSSSPILLGDNGRYFGIAGNPYNPADGYFGGTYTLRTKEGIVYTIDAVSGDLNTVSDTNGNMLTFTDAGITSNSGKSVTFERNAQGRITSVIDPIGQRVSYEYDAAGDLIAVEDRENNRTQFKYQEPNRTHFLTEIVDPLDRSGVRTEYDELGRLVKLVDANGEAVELTHDPDNALETIKDALGNLTTYEYDTRGNVVTEVDALGGVTKRTYDEENYLLKETDAEGRTKSYTYDSNGNWLTQTDGKGNTSYYTYGDFNKVLTSTDPLGNTTKYTLDKRGNVTSKTDAEGHTTSYGYNLKGQALSIRDPKGNLTLFAYDAFGNRLSEIDALGRETTYTYNGRGEALTETRKLTTPTGIRTLVNTKTYNNNGKVTSILDAEGNLTNYEFDANSNQTLVIDALGRRTQSRYDEKNKLTETIFDDGLSNRYTYNAKGDRITSTDREGRTTTITYDAVGRATALIAPDDTPNDLTDNLRKQIEYDKAGWMKAITDKYGHRTDYEYDAAQNMTRVRDNLGNTTTSTYDAAGRRRSTTDALGRTTYFTHDKLDRLVQTRFVNGTTTQTTYDSLGNVVAAIDQAGQTTRYDYDALQQLTAVTDALAQRTVYKYDESGNLVQQTDANQHSTSYEYDGLKRRTATVRPLGQRSTAIYNAVGRVISTTDFSGEVMTYDYDSNNLLTAKHFADSTSTTFTYTPVGKRQTVTDGRGTTTYTYNAQGQITSRVDPDGRGITYGYERGNLVTLTTPSGTTSYTYDELNRLKTVTAPDGGVATYGYNAVSNLTETRSPNGVVETQQYDALNQLVFLQNTDSTGQMLSSYTYTLDAVGNRTQVVENNGREVNYTYDALYRLTQEAITDGVNGNRTIGYGFDAVGNRLSRTDSEEGVTTYAYNANDWLLNETLDGQVTTYAYDANGNTLSKFRSASDQVQYTWNQENRLVGAQVTEGTGTRQMGYQYDADGVRVAQTVNGVETRYLVDTAPAYARVMEEYAPGGGTQAGYVYGYEMISQGRGGSEVFYLQDGHSGVRQLTNGAGQVTDTYAYDAYGRVLGSTGGTQNDFLYRGEQDDANVGLQYLRARYYNQDTGRFVSVDPFEGRVMEPLSRHRYIYGHDNPVSYSDPSGMVTLQEMTYTLSLVFLPFYSAGVVVGVSSLIDQVINGSILWEGLIGSGTYQFAKMPGIEFIGWNVGSMVVDAESEPFRGFVTEGTWIIPDFGPAIDPLSLLTGDDKSFPSGAGSFGRTLITSPIHPYPLGADADDMSGTFSYAGIDLSPLYGIEQYYLGRGIAALSGGADPGLDISASLMTGLSLKLRDESRPENSVPKLWGSKRKYIMENLLYFPEVGY